MRFDSHSRQGGLTEEFDEAAVAVGLFVLLFEGALVELLEAESTHKVLWVELLPHGCDAAARDGFLTAGAQRAAALVVMSLAVRLPVVVKEAAVYEWCEALLENTMYITGLFYGKLNCKIHFTVNHEAENVLCDACFLCSCFSWSSCMLNVLRKVLRHSISLRK